MLSQVVFLITLYWLYIELLMQRLTHMVTPDKVPVLSSNLASGILFIKAEMKGSFVSSVKPEVGVIGDRKPEVVVKPEAGDLIEVKEKR